MHPRGWLDRAGRWIGGEALLRLLPLVCSAYIFYPITRNYFFTDDFLNLYNINNYSLGRYLLTPNGGHLLVTRNAIFSLTHLFGGTDPAYYYWSALLAHLVNVWLLFRVIRTFTDSVRLASFGATLWGVSPLNEGALGWYSVFGHVVVATAFLIILDQAGAVALRGGVPSRSMRALWYVLALVAATSFGTGLGLAVALPFALWLLLPQWRRQSRRVPPLASLLVVIPVLYAILSWAYVRVSGDDFLLRSPWSWVVADVPGVALVFVRLMAFGLARLLLGLFQPAWVGLAMWHALLAVVFLWGGVIAVTASVEVRRRLVAVALLLFACYGTIAVGRAALLKLGPPNWVDTFFRYHYVGQLLITVIVCILLAGIRGVPGWVKRSALMGWYGVTLAACVVLAPPIDHHAEAREATTSVLAEISSSIAAEPPARAIYLPNAGFKPLLFYPSLFPGRAAAFVIFFADNTVDGRPVHFVESNRAVIAATADGRRTGGLLVPPDPSQ